MRYCLFFLLVLSSMALEVERGKVLIRETDQRAQLSIILQMGDLETITSGSTYEKDLVAGIKDALKNALPRKSELKYHGDFTHIFVTALSSQNEDVLAVFSKIPGDKAPKIEVFKADETVATAY